MQTTSLAGGFDSVRLGDNFKGRTDIYCLFQEAGVLIDKLCGVALSKINLRATVFGKLSLVLYEIFER